METIKIPSDNKLLDGAVHLAQGEIKPYVFIMCHGFRGSKDGGGKAVRMAQLAAEHGYTAVRFDFTPLAPMSVQLKELTDVLTYVRERFGLPMVGMGRSMGGAALALCAQDIRDLVGFCFWATPNDLAVTIRRALGEQYEALMKHERIEVHDEYGHMVLEKSFWDELEKYRVDHAMRVIDRPALFIHGSKDDIVLVEEGKRNYDVYCGDKEWYVVEGANHHIALDIEKTQNKLIRWLERHFSA